MLLHATSLQGQSPTSQTQSVIVICKTGQQWCLMTKVKWDKFGINIPKLSSMLNLKYQQNKCSSNAELSCIHKLNGKFEFDNWYKNSSTWERQITTTTTKKAIST